MRIQPHFPRRPSHPRQRAGITIGRSSDCDIVLDSWTVSRHHARIRHEGDLWLLEDLSSTNGTGLNGNPVIAPVALHEGDVITFGIVGMRFSLPEMRYLA
jgi:pSer/pThr/pTyr-binding forkhead associated (FHA) protein